MRVTTNLMFKHISDATNNHFNAVSELNQHSQYRVLQSGDDPVAQGRIISLNKSISEMNSYVTSASVLQTELTQLENQTSAYGDIFDEVEGIFVKISGGTLNADDLKQQSTIINGLIEDMANVLNAKNANGEYLFGGTITDKPPFEIQTNTIDIDGTPTDVDIWTYVGNSAEKLTKIGSNIELPTTAVGSDLIGSGGVSFFESVAKVQYYLSNGNDIPDTVLNEVTENLESLLENRISFESKIGVSYSRAERNTALYSNMIDEYKSLLSETQDADYVSVVTEITKQEQIMTALSSSSKIMMELAMLDFT